MANKLEILIQAKDEASKELTGVTKSLGGMSQQLKTLGIAMTAVGAVIIGTMTAITVKWAKAGDEVAKLAAKTGFTTETLSELRHAADLSGTSLAALETGIKRMARTIIDARDGLSTAVRALDDLGLSYEELKDLSPEDQFMTIASALANIEDPTLRAATAMSILGRAGTDMLPMLASGVEGLEAMRKEAHDLGIVFDADAAKAAEAFNDSITKLKAGLAGVGTQIAQVLAPILTKLLTFVTNVIKGITTWTQKHPALMRAITIVTLAIGVLTIALGSFALALLVIPKIAPAVGLAFHTMLGPIGLVTLAISGIIIGLTALVSHLGKTDRAMADLKAAAKELGDTLVSDLGGATRQAITDATAMADAQKGAIQSVIDYIKGIQTEGMDLIPEDVLAAIREISPAWLPELEAIQNGIKDTHAAYQLLTDDITKARVAEIQLGLEAELTDTERAALLSELGTLLSGEAKRLIEKNAPDLVGVLEEQQTDIDTALQTQITSWEDHWKDISDGWDGSLAHLRDVIIPAMNAAIADGLIPPELMNEVSERMDELLAMEKALPAPSAREAALRKRLTEEMLGTNIPPLIPEESLKPTTGEAYLGAGQVRSTGNIVNINLGVLPGDDVTMQRVARAVKSALAEDDRRNAFGQVNKGYFYGRSSI